MRNEIQVLLSAACMCATSIHQAVAQPNGTSSASERNVTIGEMQSGDVTADDLKIELNTPTTPSAAIIGDDSISLSSLRTASDFFGQLLTGVGEDGTLQPGIAVGGGPYWWFGPNETLAEYRDTPYPLLLLKRTQFGLATKSAPQDGENRTQVGVSLSWQLLKYQDPRFFEEGELCLARTLDPVLADLQLRGQEAEKRARGEFVEDHDDIEDPADIEDAIAADPKLADELETLRAKHLEEVEKEYNEKPFDFDAFGKARDGCRDDYSEYLRGQDSLILTVATALSSNEGKFDDFSEDKTSFWLAFKSGRKGILGGLKIPVQAFVGYTFDEQVELETDMFERADRLTVGLGASLESENESIDVQISYIHTDFKSAVDSVGDYRFTAAYSRRVADYIWLEFKAGTTNSDMLDDASFAGINLKVDTAALLNN